METALISPDRGLFFDPAWMEGIRDPSARTGEFKYWEPRIQLHEASNWRK